MPKKIYVVQETQWGYTDEWHYADGNNPVKAFLSREMAEQHCRERENAARIGLMTSGNYSWGHNLIVTFGAWDKITSLTLPEFKTQIQAFRLPELPLYPDLPMYEDGSYEDTHSSMEYDSVYTDFWGHGWWEKAWATLSEEQVDAFWSLFDRLHFYEVVEVEVNP